MESTSCEEDFGKQVLEDDTDSSEEVDETANIRPSRSVLREALFVSPHSQWDQDSPRKNSSKNNSPERERASSHGEQSGNRRIQLLETTIENMGQSAERKEAEYVAVIQGYQDQLSALREEIDFLRRRRHVTFEDTCEEEEEAGHFLVNTNKGTITHVHGGANPKYLGKDHSL